MARNAKQWYQRPADAGGAARRVAVVFDINNVVAFIAAAFVHVNGDVGAESQQ